jgi:putative ABC transport system permease protein
MPAILPNAGDGGVAGAHPGVRHDGSVPDDLGGLAAGLATLLLVALVATRLGGLGRGRELVVVTVRAVVQILLVGLVIAAVLRTPALAPVYLSVMLVVATATSARRIRVPGRSWPAAGAAITAGSALTILVVVLTRAIPFDVRHVVPLAAQVVGGAMTATSLAGQRFVDQVATEWAEIEGWLAIGATGRQAVQAQGRVAAARALVPALDQTRNVGLVTLPGAYVGLLLAGASPLDAGKLQLLVLVGLLAAESVAVVVVTRVLAPALGSVRVASRA